MDKEMIEEKSEVIESKRHHGRRRRKASFKLQKRAAVAVRGLWDAASDEERATAHRTGVAILEMWLGQASRKEVAERLEVPPLRVWQLSQQALSGMVAGLLRQPKGRRRVEGTMVEEPRWKLRKKMEKMETELASLRRLVGLLRELPVHRPQTGQKRKTPPEERSDVRASTSRDETVDRTKSSKTRSGISRAKSCGSRARRDGPNGAKLEESIKGTASKGRKAALQRRREEARPVGGGTGAEKAGQAGRLAKDRRGSGKDGAHKARAADAKTLQGQRPAREKEEDRTESAESSGAGE